MMETRQGLIQFASRDVMAERLADSIAARLDLAIADQGNASIALSGGSTPAGLYDALSRRDLDWSTVTAALVDERWVPPDAEGSNETFVRNCLKKNKAAPVTVLGLWSDEVSPKEGLPAAQARYKKVTSPFDAVVLGMGVDGHAASWFPGAQGLGAALANRGPDLAVVRANRSAVTGDHLDRMTLTLSAVKDAAFVCLLLSGEEKRDVYMRAIEDGPVEDMPVRAIIRARPDLYVAWAR